MAGFVTGSLWFVALSCAVAAFAGSAARRCALAIAGVNLIANVAGWLTPDWQPMMALNLAAMVATFWRPAGWLQAVISALFLASAVKCLAFGLSLQTQHAEMVAWQYGTGLALTQAAILCIYTGGRLVGHYRVPGALPRRGLVDSPLEADRA